MGKSCNKNPVVTQPSKTRKRDKRLANKRVRRLDVIANGSSYKKAYESWDICDYKINHRGSFDEDIVKRK